MNEKLRQLIVHAYHTVPYYNNLMNNLDIDPEEIVDEAALRKIPPVKKAEMLTTGLQNFISLDYEYKNGDDRLISQKTTGSTGEPLQFYWDQKGLAAAYFHHWVIRKKRYDINPDDVFVSTYFDHNTAEPTVQFRNNFREISFNRRKMNENVLALMVMTIYERRPKWLFLQASVAYILCSYLNDNNLKLPGSVQYIELMGEPLYDHYRNNIVKTLKVPCVNMYGCEEVKGIAYECENRKLHLMKDNVILEILDENGIPVQMGEEGEVYITGLNNMAMPFIRYHTGDRARLFSGESCSCGNHNPFIELTCVRLGEYVFSGSGESYSKCKLIYPQEKFNIDVSNIRERCNFAFNKISNIKYEIIIKNDDFSIEEAEKIKAQFLRETANLNMSHVAWDFHYSPNLLNQKLTGYLLLN